MLENIILESEWLRVKGYFNVIPCDNNSHDVVVFFFLGGGVGGVGGLNKVGQLPVLI